MSADDRAANARSAIFVSKDQKRVDWFSERLEDVPESTLRFRFEIVAEGRELEMLDRARAGDALFVDLSMVPSQAQFDLISELSAKFSGPVIAVGNVQDSGEVQRCLRAGAQEHFDTTHFRSELRRVGDRLGQRAFAPRETGRVVLVVSSNGGSGKTTIATNLAAAFDSRSRIRVGLAEFDFFGSDFTGMMRLEPNFTIADLVNPGRSYDLTMFERALTRYKDTGIQVLATPGFTPAPLLLQGESLVGIVERFRTDFPLTIIDMPHGHLQVDRRIVAMADLVLVVLELRNPSIRNTMKWLKFELQKNDLPATRYQLLANRRGQAYEISLADAESTLGARLDWSLPDAPRAAGHCADIGVPVVEELPRSALGTAFFRLAARMMDRLGFEKDEPPRRSLLARVRNSLTSG